MKGILKNPVHLIPRFEYFTGHRLPRTGKDHAFPTAKNISMVGAIS